MLSGLEIEHFFTLDESELASIRERRGPLNRLALALQVGFLKMTGGTLNSVELIPPEILDHLGRQLDCVPPRIASIRAFYRRRRRTLFEHRAATHYRQSALRKPARRVVWSRVGDAASAASALIGAFFIGLAKGSGMARSNDLGLAVRSNGRQPILPYTAIQTGRDSRHARSRPHQHRYRSHLPGAPRHGQPRRQRHPRNRPP
jgi:hypothetical protein